jgi:hypothetical protein
MRLNSVEFSSLKGTRQQYKAELIQIAKRHQREADRRSKVVEVCVCGQRVVSDVDSSGEKARNSAPACKSQRLLGTLFRNGGWSRAN